jgi:hypothetical protein
MKTCTVCRQEKPAEDYHKDSKRGLQTYCKACRKGFDKQYWKKRSQDPAVVAHKKKTTEDRVEANRRRLLLYLTNNPCVDCGEKDPVVLTFDHLRDKEFCIANAVKRFSWPKIEEEIGKCVVRCANCHMRKTAKDFNWYTYRLQVQILLP